MVTIDSLQEHAIDLTHNGRTQPCHIDTAVISKYGRPKTIDYYYVSKPKFTIISLNVGETVVDSATVGSRDIRDRNLSGCAKVCTFFASLKFVVGSPKLYCPAG